MDDFILVRTDGSPTYNFATVVDDWQMGITHIIRGDDHLSNTPRQIIVYEALGAPVPEFAHMSLIFGADGKRLSKRHGATSVEAYRGGGLSCPRPCSTTSRCSAGHSMTRRRLRPRDA